MLRLSRQPSRGPLVREFPAFPRFGLVENELSHKESVVASSVKVKNLVRRKGTFPSSFGDVADDLKDEATEQPSAAARLAFGEVGRAVADVFLDDFQFAAFGRIIGHGL